ncbi:MAG: DUF1549 domain-containing protein, partial [Pirellulales bacterium]
MVAWIRGWGRAALSGMMAWAGVGLVAATSGGAEPGAGAIDFTRDIKPLLSNHCFRCHGPDANERKGGKDGLRLDTAAGATAELGDGRAIVPGDPAASRLVQRVTAGADEQMPPVGQGRRLTPREVELLTTWIKQGAPYAQHWSYVRPQRPPLPAVKQTAWPRNPIDTFVLARLEREGLSPQPEADRYALIRRLSLDLTGLPPTLAEVDAFVNDPDPQAYERLVDRLLKKEAYGEYWAHLWLDLARYADSAGYADDPPRTIWLYRDYVIRSLNENKPFDQFTIEQLAGDLLPQPTEEQLIATAFQRNTLTNNEGGTNDEEFRNVAIVDRVNTTMAVWMGTTMNCAQCHNHKYDPLSQEDFFRFFALWNNTADADRGDESPLLTYFTPEQKQQRENWERQLAELEKQLTVVTPELVAGQQKWEQAFPRNVAWTTARPRTATAQSGSNLQIGDDGTVRLAGEPATDRYTLELPAPPPGTRALRIEALTDAALPGQGPGLAGGNFVVSSAAVSWTPPDNSGIRGRYVRIEVPGKQKILSLAEVQAFRGAENVAPRGQARQSSTDFGGDARLAIDGQTDGRYMEAKSTTHTAISDDPWWELDLGEVQTLDRLVLWNRTDPGTEDRLSQFRLAVLDADRQVAWQQMVTVAPKPNGEYALGGQRGVVFERAVADYAQPQFDAALVLQNKDPKQKGWAVGGQTGQPHQLTLVTAAPLEIPADGRVTVVLEHAPQLARHVLGKFRLSWTADARAADLGSTPLPVVAALGVAREQRTAEQSEL